MPIIRVDGPKVENVESKREFVKSVTNAASLLFGLPTETVVVLLKENAPENVGVGGQLVVDREE